jgi:hypothetical protein
MANANKGAQGIYTLNINKMPPIQTTDNQKIK